MNEFDIGFGWVKQPDDPRDFVFSSPVSVDDLPAKVRLHVPSLGEPFEPTQNQGSLGSCGPSTLVEAALYCEMAAGERPPLFSRLFLYYNARALMGTVNEDSGVDNRNLMKAAVKFGLPPEDLWPYDIGSFRIQPPESVYQAAANNKLRAYRAVPQTLAAMKQALAGSPNFQGRPIVFGFRVFESYRSAETARTGRIQLPTPGEVPIGGHDITLVGYDDDLRVFEFKNHSGPRWGDNGYGTIPYEYALNPQLASDFWVPYSMNEQTS